MFHYPIVSSVHGHVSLIEIQHTIVWIVHEIVRINGMIVHILNNSFRHLVFTYINKEPCFPNICLNGGTCTTTTTGQATCSCPEYFTGTRCDQCQLLLIRSIQSMSFDL